MVVLGSQTRLHLADGRNMIAQFRRRIRFQERKCRLSKIVFVDIETGGLKWWPHEFNGKMLAMNPIIQVAAVAVDVERLEALESFEEKCQFDITHAKPEALERNHFLKSVWETQAKPVAVVQKELSDFF